MGSIDRYIARTMLGAFALVLFSLTALVWITQALREIDIMTSQGQTVLVFLGITGLAIPTLLLMIAPIALALAAGHVLNKLSNDSEIIVMNAAGLRPLRLLRPFMVVTFIIAALVALLAAYLAPDAWRRLARWDTQVTADVSGEHSQARSVHADRTGPDAAAARTPARRRFVRRLRRRPTRSQ